MGWPLSFSFLGLFVGVASCDFCSVVSKLQNWQSLEHIGVSTQTFVMTLHAFAVLVNLFGFNVAFNTLYRSNHDW